LRFCCNEGSVEPDIEHVFGVGLGVVGPMEGLSVVRVEVHDNFGCLSVAIEDVLGRIGGYVLDPIEILEGEEVAADPDASNSNEET
jgi:hypothetical protein